MKFISLNKFSEKGLKPEHLDFVDERNVESALYM